MYFAEQMIEILHRLQKYIPTVQCADNIVHKGTYVSKMKVKQHLIMFGGDQPTVARTRGHTVSPANYEICYLLQTQAITWTYLNEHHFQMPGLYFWN